MNIIFLLTCFEMALCLLDITLDLADKEEIVLPNGLKIYYVANSDNNITSVNFKIKLYDIPSNTGMYHLLANIILNGQPSFKEYIIKHLGSFESITQVNSLNFSFEILSNYLPEAICRFRKAFYQTKITKKMITEEIQNIEDEYLWHKNDSISFYYNQYFYEVDSYNMNYFGNQNYFEEYYRNFISKGCLLTDKDGIVKFTNRAFKDMYEGYTALLPYLIENYFRKYPVSVYIKTNWAKGKIVRLLSIFDDSKENMITSRVKSYSNNTVQNRVSFIQSNRNVFCVLISCDLPNDLIIASIIYESMTERLMNVLGNKYDSDNNFRNGKLRISCRFYDFDDYDYNLLGSIIFDNEEGSKLISYNEYQRLTNQGGSSLSKLDASESYKKVAVLLKLYILNAISKIKFDLAVYNKKVNKDLLKSHKEAFNNQIYVAQSIHSVFEITPLLSLKSRNPLNLAEEFEKFKRNISDIKNYATMISYKAVNHEDMIDVQNFKHFSLDFRISEIVKKKNPAILYVCDKELNLKCFDFVPLNLDVSSFIFVYQVDYTAKGRVVLLIMKHILLKYKECYENDNFYNFFSEIKLAEGFANSLELTFLSKTIYFRNSLKSFLTSLKLFCKSESIIKDVKKKLFKEKLADVILLKEIETFSNVKEQLYEKSLYIGPNTDEILHIIYWELTVLNLKSKEHIVLVSKQNVLDATSQYKLYTSYLVLYNQDAESFDVLIMNKIAAAIFGIKAGVYFLCTNSLGFNSHIDKESISDFSYLKLAIISSKERPEVKKYVKKFAHNLNQWFLNLSLEDFENTMLLIKESLIQRKTMKHSQIKNHLSKWGFTVKYADLNDKIENFIDKLSLEDFKNITSKYFKEYMKLIKN